MEINTQHLRQLFDLAVGHMNKSGPASDEVIAMEETPEVLDKKVQSKAPFSRDTGVPTMAAKAIIDGIKQLVKNDKTLLNVVEVRIRCNTGGTFVPTRP